MMTFEELFQQLNDRDESVDIQRLGKRASSQTLRQAIQLACTDNPLSIKELPALLQRNPHYLLSNMLRPMLADKELSYTHPDNPTHPSQKYIAVPH